MEPPVPGGAADGPRTARIRWGLGDVLLAWAIGLGVSLLVAAPLVDPNAGSTDKEQVPALIAALFGQSVGVVGWLWYVARQKGLGSLRDDFGLVFRPRDVLWVAGGVALALVSGWLLIPVTELADLKESTQDVVRLFEDSSGITQRVLFTVGVVFVAPVAEELLFRGALLRALLRKTTPPVAVFISALAFALLHVVGDPGTAYYLSAFLLLGLVSGWRALRTGSVSQSIALHAGFNLLAAILIVS
jgi:membrane protease YdiL (CAAX protease family)